MSLKNDVTYGVDDTLRFLWEQRDNALRIEKEEGLEPRTSELYIKYQRKVDNYFLPKEAKAKRKKPKKKFTLEDNLY